MDQLIPGIDRASFSRAHRANEFFLARQPILNRDQELFAYELLFRNAAAGPANVVDDLSATASVIAHASELGLRNVIGSSLGFINVDAAMLGTDVIHFLPKQNVVLEILETVEPTERLLICIRQLREAGYMFALDDVVSFSGRVQQFLPLVDIVKVDLCALEEGQLERLAGKVRHAGRNLLAEKVETPEQYRHCLNLGFDYFQGYYFAKPMILAGRKLSPSQVAIMQLMAQFISDADSGDIASSIKQDASLGLGLLRLVNASVQRAGRPIDSIEQALAVLGRSQLQRWVQILLYAESGQSGAVASPLLTLATTRGKLLELIAEKLRPYDRRIAGTAFAVGIMSLMDALFGTRMEDILGQFSVADEVRAALLWRGGFYGDMLRLAEAVEKIEESGQLVPPLLEKLQLSADELNALQVAAFEWSDRIARSADIGADEATFGQG